MKNKSPIASLLALGVLTFSLTANAEITTYVCDYKIWSDVEGNHLVDKPFILTFIVDSDTGKAYMKGNAGTEDVLVILGSDFLSFIEVTDVGNVMSTTILPEGDSVHSRNSVILGDLLPSQYSAPVFSSRNKSTPRPTTQSDHQSPQHPKPPKPDQPVPHQPAGLRCIGV